MPAIPFKRSDEVIREAKKWLSDKQKKTDQYDSVNESTITMQWIKNEYDRLYKYTLAMHEEKND